MYECRKHWKATQSCCVFASREQAVHGGCEGDARICSRLELIADQEQQTGCFENHHVIADTILLIAD